MSEDKNNGILEGKGLLELEKHQSKVIAPVTSIKKVLNK